MSGERIVKVRYLAQGIITIPNNQLPKDWDTRTTEKKWQWTKWWFEQFVTQEMLCQGIDDCDSGPGEVAPGLLEEAADGEDYKRLALTNEFEAWWNCESASELHGRGF